MNWGLRDVCVRRGRALALDGVTVPAGPGRITVLIGGDGAGKSTCLQVLAGLVEADAGIARRPAKERIGYVPATAGFYADLTVQENLDFTAGAYRLPGGGRSRKADEILERTGLGGARHRLGGQLSGGMQRKLAIGLALLRSPELLLDEPTSGVDPVSRAELWRLVSAAVAGAAVAATTAHVNEAARAAFVRFGALTAVSAADLVVRRGEAVGLLGANGAGKTTLIRLLLGLLRPSGGVVLLFGSPPGLAQRRRVGYVPQTLGLYAALTVALSGAGIDAAVAAVPANLEEAFVAIVAQQARGGA